MSLDKKVYSVLIISPSEKFNSAVIKLLPVKEFESVKIVKSAALAQRKLAEYFYDIVIINTPLPDESGMRLALDITHKRSNTVVMLVVNDDIYAEVYERVSDYGVYLLGKPVSVSVMRQSLEWLKTTRERLRRFEEKTMSLEDKMAEIRLVNMAKWKLIGDYGMSEDDAHHYIEKLAMDRCIKRGKVAGDILKGEAFTP